MYVVGLESVGSLSCLKVQATGLTGGDGDHKNGKDIGKMGKVNSD